MIGRTNATQETKGKIQLSGTADISLTISCDNSSAVISCYEVDAGGYVNENCSAFGNGKTIHTRYEFPIIVSNQYYDYIFCSEGIELSAWSENEGEAYENTVLEFRFTNKANHYSISILK